MCYSCNIKISNLYYTRILLSTLKNDEKYSLKMNTLNSVFVLCMLFEDHYIIIIITGNNHISIQTIHF